MNFNCTDIILAPDQTWSNHSSLLHIPKTFSEEIPCQCRFFPKYLEWVNLPIYLWSAMSTDELGSYWSPSKFCLPNCLGKKNNYKPTNQSTAEFWTLEVLRCLNPLLHCKTSNWPPEKSWPAMDIRFSSMTFCVNLAKKSPQAIGARSIQISEKKTTQNQNKQARITSPFCRRKHKRLDLARDTSSLDFTRMSWMEIRDVNSLP